MAKKLRKKYNVSLFELMRYFIHLGYGYWGNSTSDGFINTLLLQFTYPFGNFLNRGTLINEIGFRNCLDYIQWPLAIIPSSILKLFGISKSAITSMGALTTDAYMSVMNSKKTGGIPADFLLFNYAQLGYISLLIAITVVMRFLKAVDRRIYSFKDNSAFSIVILRICLLMISTVNNFDFAVIFRMRTDLVILIAVVFWVYKKHKTVERYSI